MANGDRKDFKIAGHLCVASECRYGRCTEIPGYRISSVGDWHPECLGGGRHMIGAFRDFETMVFRIAPGDSTCECGCGMAGSDRINLSPLECIGSNSAEEADVIHELLVEQYLRVGKPYELQ